MPSIGQGTRLKFTVYEGSLKQRFEKWGRAIGPEPRAQLGLGTSMPYSTIFNSLWGNTDLDSTIGSMVLYL